MKKKFGLMVLFMFVMIGKIIMRTVMVHMDPEPEPKKGDSK